MSSSDFYSAKTARTGLTSCTLPATRYTLPASHIGYSLSTALRVTKDFTLFLLEYDLGVGDIDKIRVTPTVEVSAMVRLGVKVGFKGG